MNPNERARDLADRYWDKLLELEPILGTAVGDPRNDHRLPDLSEAGRAASASTHRSAREELEEIDLDELGEIERTTLDIVRAAADRALAELEHRTDRLGVVSHLFGPSQLIGEVASLQLADTPERLDRYEARLREVPAYLAAAADVAREGVATGVTVPRVVAERTVGVIERMISLPPERSPALLPVSEDPAASERIATVVAQVVNPAYGGFLETIRDYLPHATETIGLSFLPGGEAIYDAEILAWTTLALGAREVHELGIERWEAIQAERREIATRLGYASPAEAIDERTQEGANTPESPEALVKLAEDQVTRSWEAAPTFFGLLPSANCEVRRVEEFREADLPMAFYNPPTEDGSRRGVYYINAYDLERRALHHVASVTYHEANPGHHFQIAIEQEIPDRPAIRRFGGILAGSAFCEGWGLYSERLADEMGLYLDDWERLGMLDNQAHRAARLITDTGIHALGWTREAAVAKLEEGGTPNVDAVIEIDRYIAMPAQALSYMVGMIEIQKARAASEAHEAGAFSLKPFHDRILSLGQVPLPALRRELGVS